MKRFHIPKSTLHLSRDPLHKCTKFKRVRAKLRISQDCNLSSVSRFLKMKRDSSIVTRISDSADYKSKHFCCPVKRLVTSFTCVYSLPS
jgi:hypothetical protein